MARITVEQLTSAVASVLNLGDPADLPSHWGELIDSGWEQGYNWCRNKIAGRGFSAAQFDAWDELKQWTRIAGLYFTIHDANLDDDRALVQLDRLWNRMKELDALTLTVSGEAISPDPGDAGSNITTGTYDTTDDIFTLDSEL